MHSAVTHYLLVDAQPLPQQQSAATNQLPPVYILSMMPHVMEYPFGQFGPAFLAVSP